MSNKNDSIYPVGAIKHDGEQRASIPTTELAGEEAMAAEALSAEGQRISHNGSRNRK